MEATGAEWPGLAGALVGAGWPVSVVAPASARPDARARRRRAKTEAVAAATLADYGRDRQPAARPPAPAAAPALQGFIRQRDDLVARPTETRPRRRARARRPGVPAAAPAPLAAVLAVLAEHILALEAAIRQAAGAATSADDIARQQPLVGVGLLTAAVGVAETHRRRDRATPAQVGADAGLDPAPRQAGTSVRGAGHLRKTGPARLRPAASMAAVSAGRFNPVLRAFSARRVARGKPQTLARVAAARTLLALMVTLLHHGRDFDPTWAATHARRRP